MFRSSPWEIRRNDQYRVFCSGEENLAELNVHLLLQVNAEGKAVEGFRFAMEGPAVENDIWAQDIFEDPTLGRIRFRYEVRSGAINFRANSFTSKWEDVEELLAHGHLVAFQENTTEDKTAEVRKILEAGRAVDKNFGAGIRWCLQSAGQNELKLVLQSLPRPASQLRRNAHLAGDECPTVHLDTWPVKTTFDAARGLGPKPVLFARDPATVEGTLQAHPENLKTGKIL